MKDPIVEKIRRLRKQHAEKFDYDLDAIFEDLKKKERESNRKAVSHPPRRPRSTRSR